MKKRVVMVKKIMADGSPCRKCAEVERRIDAGGYTASIDETIVADERQPDSPGMLLAKEHGVNLAPFFLVYDGYGKVMVYQSWLRLQQEVLSGKTDPREEAMDILDANPDLDLL